MSAEVVVRFTRKPSGGLSCQVETRHDNETDEAELNSARAMTDDIDRLIRLDIARQKRDRLIAEEVEKQRRIRESDWTKDANAD